MSSTNEAEASLTGILSTRALPVFTWEGRIRFNTQGHFRLMDGDDEAFQICPRCTNKMVLRITHDLGNPVSPNPNAQVVVIQIDPFIFDGGHFALLSDAQAFTRFLRKVDEIIQREKLFRGILW